MTTHVREIQVIAEATTFSGGLKHVTLGERGEPHFTFTSDQGTFTPGGEGSEPAPVTYFVSGVTLRLFSQVSQVTTPKRIFYPMSV